MTMMSIAKNLKRSREKISVVIYLASSLAAAIQNNLDAMRALRWYNEYKAFHMKVVNSKELVLLSNKRLTNWYATPPMEGVQITNVDFKTYCHVFRLTNLGYKNSANKVKQTAELMEGKNCKNQYNDSVKKTWECTKKNSYKYSKLRWMKVILTDRHLNNGNLKKTLTQSPSNQ